MQSIRSAHATGAGVVLATLLVLAAPAGVRAAEAQKGEAPLTELTIDQVEAGIANGELRVFDNNSAEVYAKGHVPTATHLSLKFDASALPKDKGTKLVFYCKNKL